MQWGPVISFSTSLISPGLQCSECPVTLLNSYPYREELRNEPCLLVFQQLKESLFIPIIKNLQPQRLAWRRPAIVKKK